MARQHVPLPQPPRGQCGGTPALWLHKAPLSPLIKSGFSPPFPWPEVIAMGVGEELGCGGRDGQGPEGTQDVTQSSPAMDAGVEAREGQTYPYCGHAGEGGGLQSGEQRAQTPGPSETRSSFSPPPTKNLKVEMRMNPLLQRRWPSQHR